MEQTLPPLIDWSDFERTFLDIEDDDFDDEGDEETGDGPGFWLEDISPFPEMIVFHKKSGDGARVFG